MTGHVVDDIVEVVLLLWHGTEVRQRLVEGRVDLGLAEHTEASGGDLRVGFGDGRVADDRAC